MSAQEWIERLERVRNIRDWIARNLESAHARQSVLYNLKRRQQVYKLDDCVWVRNRVLSNAASGFSAKLAPKYAGPYWITKVISPRLYQVTDGDGRAKVAYVNDIKPYRQGNGQDVD